MSQGYNPYRGTGGRFTSGTKKRRVIPADSSEWREAKDTEDFINNRESQIEAANKERERLEKEDKLKDIDLKIAQYTQEIEYHKEKIASARNTDERKTFEQQIRLCRKSIKILKAKRDSIRGGN